MRDKTQDELRRLLEERGYQVPDPDDWDGPWGFIIVAVVLLGAWAVAMLFAVGVL